MSLRCACGIHAWTPTDPPKLHVLGDSSYFTWVLHVCRRCGIREWVRG